MSALSDIPQPTIIDLELTTACNLRCLHCAINLDGYRFRSLSWQALERILPFVKRHRPAVLLGGHGEPMVHPQFLDVCRALAEVGGTLSLITNGLLLNPETTDALLDLAQSGSFVHITCSIDGARPQTYNHIRRRGHFDTLRENLLRLAHSKKERGIDRPGLSIEVVAMKANQEELSLMPALAKELGAAELVVADLVEYEGFLNQSLPPGTQSRQYLEQMKKSAEDTGILLTITPGLAERLAGPAPTQDSADGSGVLSGLLPELKKDRSNKVKDCDDPWTKVFVGSNGDVRPCCFLTMPMGSLNSQGLDEIWVGQNYRTIRRLLRSQSPLTVCRLCFARGWRKSDELGWAQNLRLKVLDSLGAITNPRPTTIQPISTLNPERGRPGDPFTVSLELVVEGTPPQGTFDIHVFATGPDGQSHHWLLFPKGTQVVPFLQGWRAAPLGPLRILDSTIPQWPVGRTYSWTTTVTHAGADVEDPKTWLSSNRQDFFITESD
ncbi:MAG: hypothetical protein DRJ61_02600 [Acidobacteria bacterium]|nr:MAG: hypothetical protein DRJ61_02600 [Acidobacteriota bacterium]